MSLKNGMRNFLKKTNRAILPYKLTLKQDGGMSFKLKYLHYAKLATRKGVVDFRIDRIAGEYAYDWFNVKGVSQEDKEWFCQRGYAPRKVNMYGMTKENYKDFISSFEFYNYSTYYDGVFLDSLENKLLTYYLLAPFRKYQPHHFWHIDEKGIIYPLDVVQNYCGTVDDIVSLVKEMPIAVKGCYGGHGKGFYLYEYKANDFYISGEKTDEKSFREHISSLRNYILQEYLIPSKDFVELCGEGAFAVYRMIVMNNNQDGQKLSAGMIRLGSKNAGLLTDYPGTITCGVTIDEGKIFKPLMWTSETERLLVEKHPDTGKQLEGYAVNNWEELKNLAIQIARYLPWIGYVTIDIIPSDKGFKILEINSHGQSWEFEAHFPFNLNKYNRIAFGLPETPQY